MLHGYRPEIIVSCARLLSCSRSCAWCQLLLVLSGNMPGPVPLPRDPGPLMDMLQSFRHLGHAQEQRRGIIADGKTSETKEQDQDTCLCRPRTT